MRKLKLKAMLQELIDFADQHGLEELEVERSILGRVRVRLVRRHRVPHQHLQLESTPKPGSPPVASPFDAEAEHLHTIRSPMVGILYRSPSPDAPPYVTEDDVVSPGQVVCIIEAMKIMNEIESDVKGRVVRILVENAQPVEYHQPLLLIEPVDE